MSKEINRSVISIPKISVDDFFSYWVEFTKPFHRLTEKEGDVFAEILKMRASLEESVINAKILDSIVLSTEHKAELRKTLGMSAAYFNCVFKKLKDAKVITEDNRIVEKLIPKVTKTAVGYEMIISFDFSKDE